MLFKYKTPGLIPDWERGRTKGRERGRKKEGKVARKEGWREGGREETYHTHGIHS